MWENLLQRIDNLNNLLFKWKSKDIQQKKNIRFINKFIKQTINKKNIKIDWFLLRTVYKYKYSFYINIIKQLEISPEAFALVTKAISIIRNYENSASFNKIQLFKLLWERWKPLNIYYYLYSKYFSAPQRLTFFIPKKYKKLTDFFIETSTEKTKKILLYYNDYYESNKYLENKLMSVFWWFLIFILSIIILIVMVWYMNNFFMINLIWKFDWNYYYGQLTTIEHIIFNNTIYLGLYFNKSWQATLNLSPNTVNNGFINNIFFWIWSLLLVGLIIYVIYYVISQYNKLTIFKYVNERNFNIWFSILLERIKVIESIDVIDENTGSIKKIEKISFKNENIYKLFNTNLNKIYDYKILNLQSKHKMFIMWIMNQKSQWKIFKKDTFFSEKYRIFWIEIFDLVNKWSQWKFNLWYLEQHLKNRYDSFKVLWNIEVDKITNILWLTFIVATTIITIALMIFQFWESQYMSNAVELYQLKSQNR